jgi:serine O-acetyltransferase
MLFDARFREDLARCGGARAMLREQSLWAIAVLRFGHRADARPRGLRRWISQKSYWPLFRVVETITGISIPKSVHVGPGLRIWHFGCIFVHQNTRIGSNVTLRQGVTLGNRHNDGKAPTIEDDVEIGAHAQVLGGITIGKGAKIGTMAVVLKDVPAGATAVGNPARVLERAGEVERAGFEKTGLEKTG